MDSYYAHTLEDHPESDWQPLQAHLENVGFLAAEFAEPFGAGEWARLAGSWHDLGKYSGDFQDYLKSASSPDPHTAEYKIKIDHSTAGAQHAVDALDLLGHLLAYAISGHHSGLDPQNETVTSRLAAENWDAPLVVTTSVQFYESLFANRSSRCRKLHNLVRSVIILDEAQALPVDYLEPCLRSLGELSRNYGATLVLCTATQPAIHIRDGFTIGLDRVREIIPDPNSLYKKLKRVDVEEIGHQSDEDLTSRLLEEERVLCIVNTRSHAQKLFEMVGGAEGHFHLSALMCPAHRREVFGSVREHLESGPICRVITTQLVETGVDIDFPVVYRSLAGLDSIAQAAGR